MNEVNPKYVLRNYMAQMAIDEAEKGNYHLVYEMYEMLKNHTINNLSLKNGLPDGQIGREKSGLFDVVL